MRADACLSCLLHCFSFLPFRQRLRPRTRRPYRHPCLLQAVPPSPRKSNNSDNYRDLRYLRFLNKGSQLKELAELLTKAGTNCPSPALDAEGGRTGSGDNLVCRMQRWLAHLH